MQSWIVTGGVACGKSSISRILSDQGGEQTCSFSSDEAVRQLQNDPTVIDQMVAAFGHRAAARGCDGSVVLDRLWLRERVFADDSARKLLESLLHPGVLRLLTEARGTAARRPEVNLFLAEVPLYYEIGAPVSADLVIVVAASRAVQVRRLMEHRGLDIRIIERMLSAQWPIEAKVERADAVIWNDGDPAALEQQVLTLARQLWYE